MSLYQSRIEQRQNAQTIEKSSCLKAILHVLYNRSESCTLCSNFSMKYLCRISTSSQTGHLQNRSKTTMGIRNTGVLPPIFIFYSCA